MRAEPMRIGMRTLTGISTSPPTPPLKRTPSCSVASAVASNESRISGTKSSSHEPPLIRQLGLLDAQPGARAVDVHRGADGQLGGLELDRALRRRRLR